MDNSSELEESNAHNFSLLDLTHLRLLSVWFPYTPWSCERFANLTHLELVDATYSFGQSIFFCPVLEKLTLIICRGLFPNNFCAPNLKCLIQVYHKLSSKYSLAGLENLEEYSLMLLEDCSEEMQTFNVVIIPGSVHKIEKFSLAGVSLKVIFRLSLYYSVQSYSTEQLLILVLSFAMPFKGLGRRRFST